MTCCELRNQNKSFVFFAFNASKLFFLKYKIDLDSVRIDTITFIYTCAKYIKDTTTLLAIANIT